MFAVLSATSLCAQTFESCDCPQIVGTSDLSSIFSGSSLTNACFVLDGTLTIDKDFDFDYVNIGIKPNSTIVVSSGVKVSFSHSRLEGCGGKWQGVKATDSNSKITFKNNTLLRDAVIGVELDNGYPINTPAVRGHKLYIQSGSIIRNSTNILKLSGLYYAKISDASLFGDSPDVPSVVKGIVVIQLTPAIGTLIIERSSITMHSPFLTTAIDMIGNSSSSIYFEMKDNSSISNSNYGIYSRDLHGIKKITNSSITGFISYGVHFLNSNDGITIENNVFNGLVAGAAIFGVGLGGHVSIKENYISNLSPLLSNSNNGGINIYIKDPGATTFNLYHNTITNFVTGIYAAGPYSSSFGLFQIKNNIINNNLRNRNAIHVSTVAAQIEDNNISIKNGNGINLTLSRYAKTVGNFINTVAVSDTIFSGNGIHVDFTDNSFYKCNRPTNFENGIFATNSCDFSDFKDNKIGNSNFGFHIAESSQISPQKDKWNIWNGTYHSGLGARYDNDPTMVFASQFTVSTPLGSIYHPVHTPTDLFVNSTNPLPTPSIEPCPPVTGGGDGMTMEHLLQMLNYSATTNPLHEVINWEGKSLLFRYLDENPAVRNQNAALQSFYATEQNTSIGKFYVLDKQLANISMSQPVSATLMTTARTDYYAAMDAYVETHHLYDQNLTTIEAVIAAYQALHTAVGSYRAFLLTNQSHYENQLLALDAQNTAIATSTAAQGTLAAVNSIFYKTVAKGNYSLTPAQSTVIQSVVSMCPKETGHVVHWARLIDRTTSSSVGINEYVDNCSSSLPRVSTLPYGKDWSIFPNPAADVAVIDFVDLPYEPFTIQLVDLNGSLKREVKSMGIAPIRLDLNALQGGLYVVKIIQGGHTLSTKKLVVIR